MSTFPSVAQALEELVPPFDSVGDWDEILRRTEEPKGWRGRPRLMAGAIALAVLVALLATPAFGVQGLVLHLLGRKNVSFSSSAAAPNKVKKDFEDLFLGAPPPWAPEAIASEARDAGTFVVGGHPRQLYVVPTKRGGYCWQFQLGIGGCRQKTTDRAARFSASWMAKNMKLPGWPIVQRLSGDLTQARAASITVHYADGTTADIPFIWVSKPIAAGFYSFDVPVAHQTVAKRVRSVTVQAQDGTRLGIETFLYERKPAHIVLPPMTVRTPPKHSLDRTAKLVPPLTSASADGFRVVVGRNDEAQFTQIAETPATRQLAGGQAGFNCFRLTREFGIFTVRGFGVYGRFANSVAVRLNGVGRPVDGCEIQGTAGHLWPEVAGSHSAVEVPFTAAGRAYFANRAAARDLALFVRTRRVQQIRRERPAQAIRDLQRVYGKPLAKSAIRLSAERGGLVFRERSTTGRLFTVVVRGGKIAHENVRPLAFVF